jgi:hypothetical protein
MFSPKIIKIKPVVDEYVLLVLFENKITKKVDIGNKLSEEFYCDLEKKYLFGQAKVYVGGYGVSWNDDIDISEFELWNIGIEVYYNW